MGRIFTTFFNNNISSRPHTAKEHATTVNKGASPLYTKADDDQCGKDFFSSFSFTSFFNHELKRV